MRQLKQLSGVIVSVLLISSCCAKKNLNINYVDTVKVVIPVEIPEKTAFAEISDSSLLTLTPGSELTRETDTTIITIYRDTSSYRIKTIFKPSIIKIDTAIVIDTVLSVIFKDRPKKAEKTLLDKVKKNYVLSIVFGCLIVGLIIIIIRRLWPTS